MRGVAAPLPKGTAAFADDSDLDFLDGTLRYIGQTLIRHYGGKWVFDDNKESIFCGLPVVVLDGGGGWPLSPRHLITATVLRRTPVVLEVYDAQEQAYADMHGAQAAREAAAGSGSSEHTDPTVPTAWAAGASQRAEAWAADHGGEFVADFSEASLPGLSACVAGRIPDLAALDDPDNEEFVLGAVACLGETMCRAAGGVWAHGPGERDRERSRVVGVPFLTRDDGPDTIGGHPYWGIYDLVDGDPDSARDAFRSYVHPYDA